MDYSQFILKPCHRGSYKVTRGHIQEALESPHSVCRMFPWVGTLQGDRFWRSYAEGDNPRAEEFLRELLINPQIDLKEMF